MISASTPTSNGDSGEATDFEKLDTGLPKQDLLNAVYEARVQSFPGVDDGDIIFDPEHRKSITLDSPLRRLAMNEIAKRLFRSQDLIQLDLVGGTTLAVDDKIWEIDDPDVRFVMGSYLNARGFARRNSQGFLRHGFRASDFTRNGDFMPGVKSNQRRTDKLLQIHRELIRTNLLWMTGAKNSARYAPAANIMLSVLSQVDFWRSQVGKKPFTFDFEIKTPKPKAALKVRNTESKTKAEPVINKPDKPTELAEPGERTIPRSAGRSRYEEDPVPLRKHRPASPSDIGPRNTQERVKKMIDEAHLSEELASKREAAINIEDLGDEDLAMVQKLIKKHKRGYRLINPLTAERVLEQIVREGFEDVDLPKFSAGDRGTFRKAMDKAKNADAKQPGYQLRIAILRAFEREVWPPAN